MTLITTEGGFHKSATLIIFFSNSIGVRQQENKVRNKTKCQLLQLIIKLVVN